jgi:hypothetical protein
VRHTSARLPYSAVIPKSHQQQHGRRSPVSAIGLMQGGKACATVSALLAARSALNSPTGLICLLDGRRTLDKPPPPWAAGSPEGHAVAGLRDRPLSTVKTVEHFGYGRACAAQVAGEHPRPLLAQLFEEDDRLSPGR